MKRDHVKDYIDKSNKCKGCNISKLICSVPDNFKNNCPCRNCPVKVICMTMCQTRVKYFVKKFMFGEKVLK